jgi:hypothetical protein
MARTTKNTPAKKKAASSGAAELKAFRDAIQNLKETGSALAKAARSNKKLRSTVGVRSALDRAQNVASSIAKSIPAGPPPTTVPR